MKLDRTQDLNVLYKVCVFWADPKNKMAPLAFDWLLKIWLWLTSPLKPLNRIQWNLRERKISTSSTKFVLFGPISKQKWLPMPIRQKGGTLYSGARFVALLASSVLLFYFFPTMIFAFYDFSAICHWVFLIFGQLIENNLYQSSRSRDDTRWKFNVSNFSIIFQLIFLKFSWSLVLDKGKICFKFPVGRFKVKVTRTHPWQISSISCTLFTLLLLNQFQWNLAGIYSTPSIHPMNFQVCSLKGQTKTKQKMWSVQESANCTIQFK